MSTASVATAPQKPPLDHDTAAALRAHTRDLEHDLLAALEAQAPRLATDRLEAVSEHLDALETALAGIASDAAGPLLERLRVGLDRLACDLYQRDGWAHLDEAAFRRLLARHSAGLTRVDGIGPASAEVLFQHGISDPERLLQLQAAELDEIRGLNAAVLARLKHKCEAAGENRA
ncbi:helix-hairpin-helix domain-containing protein [Billgrantia kenyensis]|uniref:Helix-hairpin-helix domain-containing protein n=1 Tax=Billgrantia kenyensis TaxID=321266 RepID=A0A7V9VY50_9GAMM|nr:helix-hairpin-helix domain-containing protein [Halomonas kenyensis]MBA2777598.1 helix-hairpin-helix domain-containing protein [Halomonas kenyensis]MCG6660268.1 helix-hairpin-helix domain-containing protein [Halomonas kenyensis]